MENNNLAGVTGAGKANEETGRKTASMFLLVVGGLLVFWAAESILSTAGLWSKTATDYAGGVVLGLLGALVLYRALRN
jgi:hypothetical protein